jgi:hypothetical protein
MNSISQLNHQDEFQRSWTDPSNTNIELPPIDVNRVLAEHYKLSEPLTFTRSMLWDMEVRKSWRPDLYIPSVVLKGSAQSWGQSSAAEGAVSFNRSSQQRLWLESDKYGLVLEQTLINCVQQKVSFIAAADLAGPDGNLFQASVDQPLFHVEHSVGGAELQPLNRWRIAFLTGKADPELAERCALIASDVYLPEFIEIYIRNELNIKLTRQDIR